MRWLMRCWFYIEETLVGTMLAEPRCGKDFCDKCGDCLHCYGGDPCIDKGEHQWIKYVRSVDEAKEIAKEYGTKFEPKED